MAFIVQDDAGDVVGANALIDVAYLRSYHADRGNSLGVKTDAQLQQAIVQGTDRLGDWRFRGVKIGSTPFPRHSAGVDGIPETIKQANAEYALYALSAPLYITPTQDATGQVISHIRKEVTGAVVKDITYDTKMGLTVTQAVPAGDRKVQNSGLLYPGGSTLVRG